jgi:hypothetical protein
MDTRIIRDRLWRLLVFLSLWLMLTTRLQVLELLSEWRNAVVTRSTGRGSDALREDQSEDCRVLSDGRRRRICTGRQELSDDVNLRSVDGLKHRSQTRVGIYRQMVNGGEMLVSHCSQTTTLGTT